MRADVVRVMEFTGEIDRIKRPAELLSGLKERLAPFGVTSLSVNLIQSPGQPVSPRALLGEQWRDWADDSGRFCYGEHDPAVRMLLTRSRPFAWSEALAHFRSIDGDRLTVANFGVASRREAFVVPVREPDGTLLATTFSGPQLDLAPEVRYAMHLAGYYFATRGREIVEAAEPGAHCPLTPRQLECLRWVHAGKTDHEIAMLLGVSPRTVHNHVEAAKAVFNTPKRSTAAFEARRRGWLADAPGAPSVTNGVAAQNPVRW
ncbi:MAG TPA: LuxR C-terminal-related transcriptional regulator [Phenylobacterium sp.]|uniref:helix-turn-helix transcriptional regulator n=1 Tax=Phenylobacterium sp. TaxID=1871053 RepID=UPI002B4883DA|nr:LuxR C-terminal-related transcriptional regulator [Phenylobacterium sp.]HKR87697.1 LuxR C-terminal-related transcriptional regulator [Phenylobacterium sp.]